MPDRPRLLFLAQSLPFPPHSGVAVRTYNVLRELQREFDVDLVAFSRLGHQPDAAAREAARDALRATLTHVAEPTPVPNEGSGMRRAWDHLRSVVTGRAYTYYEYRSGDYDRELRRSLRERPPALVHLDSLDLHGLLPHLPSVPIACTHHDIDSALLRSRARWIGSAPRRMYLELQAGRVERVERAITPRLALNVLTSETDERRLHALAPGAATVVIPNGTDTDYFRPTGAPSIDGRVVFVGPTNAYPNRDAVEWMLETIWPRIHGAAPAASLRLVGRSASELRARYDAVPGVTTLGQVPDLRPALSEAQCCVVPIRIGGGTRLKILDAWAMGKAVVSTTIGCEGLAAVDGENILVRDTPDAFAEAVRKVLRDPVLREQLERNARRTAAEHYGWAVIGERLRRSYHALIGTAGPGMLPVAHRRGEPVPATL